jgi:hypothetical protein
MLLLLPGCALFTAKNTDQSGLSSGLPWSKRKSAAEAEDGPTLSMVRLEASIVRRPVNDARVRRHVWEELDESGLELVKRDIDRKILQLKRSNQ